MKKFFVLKLFIVCVFLFVSYMICGFTKYYIAPIYYGDEEIRVIIDDAEVTRNMPDVAVFVDGKAMLSFDTIKKYFDEYIYFDEKYNTVIITGDTDIIKMELDDNSLNLNGTSKNIKVPAKKINGVIYVPVEELQKMYNIAVVHNEKLIITTDNIEYKEIKMNQKEKVKLYKKQLSLTTGKVKAGEILTVFSGEESEEYAKVRTPNGDLGYVKRRDLDGTIVLDKKIIEDNKNAITKKINLTWEYAENYTPNRLEQEKIEGLNIISPTWIYMKNTSGDIKFNTLSSDYIKWAKSKGYTLWPTLKNDSMGIEKTSALVTDMYARENIISNVVELALKYGFEGINIDFENMKLKDKDEFSQFIREFSATLRRNNLIASIDVNVPDGSETWSLCYDHKAISDACDYLMLMAYDQYGRTKAGPVASLTWVENNINKVIEREKVDNKKLVLCVPFYSKYRKDKITMSGDEEILKGISTSTLYMKSVKNYLANSKFKDCITWDEELGQYYVEYRSQNILERIWAEDENALKEKVKLVNKYNLAGVASWRWGFETPESWQVINETLNKK